MKLPFGRRARQRKTTLKRARDLLNQLAKDREDHLRQELEDAEQAAANLARQSTFHSTTVYQLQMLVDCLREQNLRLQMEVERPTSEQLVTLNRAEAALLHTILELDYADNLNEDDPFYNSQIQIRALIDRLHHALRSRDEPGAP